MAEFSVYTEDIIDLIRSAKAKMPAGWRIITDDSNEYYLILDVPVREFEKYSLNDRIRIAEATNELCLKIQATGLRCVIQKA